MVVKSLDLKNFRNYHELHIDFDPFTNIFYGNNAQGKTNILESVYLGGTTKSHKGSKDRDMITFTEEESHIRMLVQKKNLTRRIDMHLKKNKTKGIAVDGIPIKKASELFGIVNLVFFSPEDLNIIKNGPSERRRFIDLELCQLDKIYFHNQQDPDPAQQAAQGHCLSSGMDGYAGDLGYAAGRLRIQDHQTTAQLCGAVGRDCRRYP